MSGRLEILMATYNGERFLREQVDSILAQTDGDWTLTISDDGSADSTPDIIDDYVRRYPDRVRRHRSGRRFGNARDHFFHLMRSSEADFLLFCDQDDVWHPEKVEKTRRALEEGEARWGGETPLLVFSDQVPTDAELNPLAPSLMRYQKQYFHDFDYRSILMQNVVTGGAMGVNRVLARRAGEVWDASRVVMHDWWLAAVAARFGHIVYLDEPLGEYRQHGNNAVGAKAVGSAGYVRDRLAALGEVRGSIARKKAQAGAFRQTYEPSLDAGDIAFLRAFERPRSGFAFYWRHRGLIHGAVRRAGMLLLG